jgi:outer membrane cobalamin receptor
MPLNDAFGGWVFWDKVPQAAIDRIEVDRGSSSDLYGADALGGVIQVLTVRPNRPLAACFSKGQPGHRQRIAVRRRTRRRLAIQRRGRMVYDRWLHSRG